MSLWGIDKAHSKLVSESFMAKTVGYTHSVTENNTSRRHLQAGDMVTSNPGALYTFGLA